MTPLATDFALYSAESKRLGLNSPRCPFQNVNACPRYFYSLSLLGQYGCTKLDKSEDDRLKALWVSSPLAPQTREQDTHVDSAGEKISAYNNFCPEVAFDRFGIFATYLSPHVDEIDTSLAHERLGREGAPAEDPRWTWRAITPQHYSECPFYSQLSHGWPKLLARGQTPVIGAPSSSPPRFDVFISHASEDKETFVRALAAELARLGLRVWYDESTLKLGDSLRDKIDEGLASSEYGVVVLSAAFFSKNWPQAELGGLFAREMQGRKVILPVRHGLTQADVVKHSPLLADKLATLTEKGVETVAAEIFAVVRPKAPVPQIEPKRAAAARRAEPITNLLGSVQEVSPLLYKLDELLAGEDARRFVSAMQRFFAGTNLLTVDVASDLLVATDNLLRVCCAAGDLHYQCGKFATALHHLDLYRKQGGFDLKICGPWGGQGLRSEIHFLHGCLLNMIERGKDNSECNMRLLRLNIAILQYAEDQVRSKHGFPKIGPTVHHALREFLSPQIAKHLGGTLPDPIDTVLVSDMKNYCRAAWNELETEDKVALWEFVSCDWLTSHLRFWKK